MKAQDGFETGDWEAHKVALSGLYLAEAVDSMLFYPT